MVKITLASKAGFCFGVKRAFDLALKTQAEVNEKIYTLGPLIHNSQAVEHLETKGIIAIDMDGIGKIPKNSTIIIRAHGVPPKTIEILKSMEFNVIDATCPYVIKIHRKAKEFYEKNYEVVILGDETHPEIIGINGWCENKAHVVEASDLGSLSNLEGKNICVLSQTTEKAINWNILNNHLDNMSCKKEAFNTICNATSERQISAEELAKTVDLMIVIGGKYSSNTIKLFDICKKYCENTIHIESIDEILELIKNMNHISSIGVTAGASTPDWIIKEAIDKMNNISLNEQMEYLNNNDFALHVGKKVKGEVVSITKDALFINLNYKADGIIPKNETGCFEEEINLKDKFAVGEEIEAKIVSMKNSDGYVVLSRLEIVLEKFFDELQIAFSEQKPISLKIMEHVKGGLIGSYQGIRTFIPASHASASLNVKYDSLVGKEFMAYLIEFSPKSKGSKIIASIKNYELEKVNSEQEKAWAKISENEIYTGIVKRITDFGAFVEVEGIDGLVHISEISWGRVYDIHDILKLNQKVSVLVIKADKENRKLSLSIKQASGDPWNNISEKYPEGSVVLGKVVRFADFGAFVELEPGVDALVHVSQISHKKITKPEEVLTIGETIKAKITSVDSEKKKIGLSIKDLGTI